MAQREGDLVTADAESPPAVRLVLDWEGDERYRGGRAGGPGILIDASRERAPGPVDVVVLALASCTATDLVEILAKRRTPARSLRITADFTRDEDRIPRRLASVRLTFHVATDSAIQHVRHALSLALDKYCSVAGSLAPDIRITADAEVVAP